MPLTYTSFGGPNVHIALFMTEFVENRHWLSSQVFAELFAICQSLPGPASTQLAYAIALLRGGMIPGLLSFVIWIMPCMLIMTAFGIGVASLPDMLPKWLIGLQNGLTSAAVGLVALAAFKLGVKILDDRISLLLGAISASLAINFHRQVWLFPVLMVSGGFITAIHEFALRLVSEVDRINAGEAESLIDGDDDTDERNVATVGVSYSIRTGIFILLAYFILLVGFVVLNALNASITWLNVLSNMYFVGAIIFGGGPVIIALLQSYAVNAGWLSDREFLIGMALINALPGPNFNIAAFVGALALRRYGVWISILGAVVGAVGIFMPALLLITGIMPLWSRYRVLKGVQSALKGVNAAAVGLVYSAVYLLSLKAIAPVEGGGLSPPGSLFAHPAYIAVAIISYTSVGFLGLPAPLAILCGGLYGILQLIFIETISFIVNCMQQQ